MKRSRSCGNSLIVAEESDRLRVSNGRLMVTCCSVDGLARVELSAAAPDGEFVPICHSLRPDCTGKADANPLFDTSVNPHRYLADEIHRDFSVTAHTETKVEVTLRGAVDDRIVSEETLTLRRGSASLHVEVSATLAEPRLDYFLSSWVFLPEGAPDFVHSPTAKKDGEHSGPAANQVIGDHAFHSPAIVLQKNDRHVCLVPDLNTINEHALRSADARRTQRVERNRFSVPIVDEFYTMPTAMDLTVRSGLTEQPVFSYGLMDFVVAHHVRYARVNDDSMIRSLESPKIRYGYDLIAEAGIEEGHGFQTAARTLWQKYGHRQFTDEPHLAMPFAEYVRTIYEVVSQPMPPEVQAPVSGHEDHGVFVDFKLNGSPVGGMVSPVGQMGFVDALWNSEFWNNIRDASGMVYWGDRLGVPKLRERGERIINLALQAPQNEAGFFPLVYHVESGEWVLSTLGPAPSPKSIFDRTAPVYDVVAMSKSGAHMLEYNRRCGPDQRIADYLKPFADGLVARIDERGAIPSYYTKDMEPIADLQHSAQPAAMMWFLAEMAGATGDAAYTTGAERIAAYLKKEILPQQRWVDLEVYYSCGQNPLSYTVDLEQTLPIRGNLSTIWAAKAFLALYGVTGNPEKLHVGEKVIDYLSFSQAVWNPHYIYTANPFGGCTVDNVDTATWLDARQCELVDPFIRFGLALGRQDLLERGVAAARASAVLINHPRHIENGIYPHVNLYGFGLGPENINHEGHNQSAMRTHPSWGECSGVFTGLADAARCIGGGLLDLDLGIAVGADGVNLSMDRREDGVHVAAEGRFAKLKRPWEHPYDLNLMVRGAPHPVLVNGHTPAVESGLDGSYMACRVGSDGRVLVNAPEKKE